MYASSATKKPANNEDKVRYCFAHLSIAQPTFFKNLLLPFHRAFPAFCAG